MSDRPDSYFTLFVGDYLRDTMHLSTRQHGAYQLLLMHYYGTGRPLPDDEDMLRAISREGQQDWKVDRPVVMAFFHKESDGWHQTRADKELASANARYNRAVKAANAKHSNKHVLSSAQAGDKQVLNSCLEGANPNPNPNQPKQEERSPTATALPSTTPLDFKKELWARGVLFLKNHSIEERDARSIIGRWRKSHGDLEVLNALASAEGASVSDPIPYVTAVLAGKAKPNGTGQSRRSAADIFSEFYREGLQERAHGNGGV